MPQAYKVFFAEYIIHNISLMSIKNHIFFCEKPPDCEKSHRKSKAEANVTHLLRLADILSNQPSARLIRGIREMGIATTAVIMISGIIYSPL